MEVPNFVKDKRGDEFRNLLFLRIANKEGKILNKNRYIQYQKEQEEKRKTQEEQAKKWRKQQPAELKNLRNKLESGAPVSEGEIMMFNGLLQSLNKLQYNINDTNPILWPIWRKKVGGKGTRKHRKGTRRRCHTRKH